MKSFSVSVLNIQDRIFNCDHQNAEGKGAPDMRNRKLVIAIVLINLLQFTGVSCRQDGASVKPETTDAAQRNEQPPPRIAIVMPDDPADFVLTAEAAFKLFREDQNTVKGEKYVDKVLEIKGRFKEIDIEKRDSNGRYLARLNAGRLFEWVTCSVDEDQKESFAALRPDQMVVFKGLGDRFWIAGPRMKHCVVITN
jgi:hypothetical protein